MTTKLIETLERMKAEEKWKRKARHSGEIIKKNITGKGNIFFVIKKPKYDVNAVVPKHRRKEFELAKGLKLGDRVSIIGEEKINLVICDRIKKISKNIGGKQTKLKFT